MAAASGVLGVGGLGAAVLGGNGGGPRATAVTIVGQLSVQPGVEPPAGSVVLVQLSVPLYDLAGQPVIGNVPQTVRVNAGGGWQLTVYATDDPTTTGGPAYYQFSFRTGTANWVDQRSVSVSDAPTVLYEELAEVGV